MTPRLLCANHASGFFVTVSSQRASRFWKTCVYRQVALLKPKIIVAMGRFAVQSLLAGSVPDVESQPLGKLRGRVYSYEGVPVVVTYHPAYLLRNPGDKRLVWEDIKLVMERLALPVPSPRGSRTRSSSRPAR